MLGRKGPQLTLNEMISEERQIIPGQDSKSLTDVVAQLKPVQCFSGNQRGQLHDAPPVPIEVATLMPPGCVSGGAVLIVIVASCGCGWLAEDDRPPLPERYPRPSEWPGQ